MTKQRTGVRASDSAITWVFSPAAKKKNQIDDDSQDEIIRSSCLDIIFCHLFSQSPSYTSRLLWREVATLGDKKSSQNLDRCPTGPISTIFRPLVQTEESRFGFWLLSLVSNRFAFFECFVKRLSEPNFDFHPCKKK